MIKKVLFKLKISCICIILFLFLVMSCNHTEKSANTEYYTFNNAVNLVINDVHKMYNGDILVINENKFTSKNKFVKFSKILDFRKLKIINSDYYLENKKITICVLEIKNNKDTIFIDSEIILGLRESASFSYKIGMLNGKLFIIKRTAGLVS